MKAYDQGYRDFKKGQIENPYKANTNRHRDWQFGFDRAYFENLKRVKSRERGEKVS
jgi:vacuolar-type H+-ATPase subunit C/Vma6